MFYQQTICDALEYTGITLHSGETCRVLLEPAGPNEGITINGLPVSPHYILSTIGMTTHGKFSQTEHLLSGLYGLNISNLKITLDQNEFPILGGGSREIIDAIKAVGIKRFTELRSTWSPGREVIVTSGDAFVKYTPGLDLEQTQFTCSVDFPYVGQQEYSWVSKDADSYYDRISNAKTFFFDTQLAIEQVKPGRCQGIRPDNCLILTPESCFNDKEFARHKLLDLIGDMNIFNMIIPGHFHAHKAGHKLHNELIYKLWSLWAAEQPMEPIPYIRIPSNYDLDHMLDQMKTCIQTKAFLNSHYVSALEENLKKYIGCKHVLATNSGTSSLMLALMALELPKESYVLMPDLTFWATYEAVKLVGLRPIVLDVDDHFQMNFDLIKKLVKERDVKAVMLVHLYGFVHPEYDDIVTYCKDHGVHLVEDGSHSFGTLYKGESIFKKSHLAGISLFPTKMLGSCGNAGIITTNCDRLAHKIRMYRDNGRDKFRYQHELIGTNSIMNAFNAIYTNSCLLNFPRTLYKLQTIFQIYQMGLTDLQTMRFARVEHSVSNSYMSILMCQIPHMLQRKLKQFRKAGIFVENVYPNTISRQPGYDRSDMEYLNGTSVRICENIINLPSYYGLSDVEQRYIIETIRNFDKIDLVLIGVGRMGSFHLKELRNNPRFNIMGYIDDYIEALPGLTKFTSVKDASEAGAFACIIAANTEAHYDLVDQCLECNLHVLVEKPAFVDVKSHQSMIQKAEGKGLNVAVGMIERYNPNYTMAPMDLTQVKHIGITRIARVPNHGNTSLVLYDLLCHDLDLLLCKYRQPVTIESVISENAENAENTENAENAENAEKDIWDIKAKMGNTRVDIKVGYSNDAFERTHIFQLSGDHAETRIDLSLNSQNLLPYEHNDFIALLLNKDNQICTLADSQIVIEQLNQISKMKV
jgi:UDP-2-acetamido-2-deoxy-ribo-hexuluronate aminotransferase